MPPALQGPHHFTGISDEDLADLGNRLSLSPRTEPLRAKLERELTPIVNPRPRGPATGPPAERPEGADESVGVA